MRIRPIKTRADHRAAIKEIERLMDAKPGTPAGDRLEVLATLVDRYESEHEAIEPPDPIEALLYHMESRGLTRRDLEPYLGSRARVLDTALPRMNTAAHMFVGELLHDRIIGALELCCRRGEMLLIQNKRVNWETHQIGIPGATAKDRENRRIPFNPNGRLTAILKRRAAVRTKKSVLVAAVDVAANDGYASGRCRCSCPFS